MRTASQALILAAISLFAVPLTALDNLSLVSEITVDTNELVTLEKWK